MKGLTFAGSIVLVVAVGLRLVAQDPPGGAKPAAVAAQGDELLDEFDRVGFELHELEDEARMLRERADTYAARIMVLRNRSIRAGDDDFVTGEPRQDQVDRAASRRDEYRAKYLEKLKDLRLARRKLAELEARLAIAGPGGEETVCVVAHVDVMPNFTAAGRDLLRQLVADSRKDAGAVRVEVFEESARPNHSTVVAVWRDRKAYEDHLAADHTRASRATLQPMLGSPFDERLHRPGR